MFNDDNKNLFMVMVLSMAILFGWQYLTPEPPKAVSTSMKQEVKKPKILEPQKKVPRLALKGDSIQGSISLQGALIDDILLKKYGTTPEPKSDRIRLLGLDQGQGSYISLSWIQENGVEVVHEKTPWSTKGEALTPQTPVTLTWQSQEGLSFERRYEMDDHYLVTVKETVTNTTKNPVTLAQRAVVHRFGTPKTEDSYILHEGGIGYFNNTLTEVKYKDMKKTTEPTQAQGGWLGMTDKYWLVAFIPSQDYTHRVSYDHEVDGFGRMHYRAVSQGTPITLNPGEPWSIQHAFYVGAKKLSLLEHYEKKLSLPHLDLAVDFGWFYIITKPIFTFLTMAQGWVGNFGIAILILTFLIKGLFFPIALKQHRSMAAMKALQPKIKALQEKYKEDRMMLNQKMMALYKKEGANPLAGCMPLIIQIPVFFALYKVLFITIEMRHAPFFGWIKDLSAADPLSLFNLFGLLPYDVPSFLMIGPWPLFMGVTMFFQQRLNPTPMDPNQAKVMMVLPFIFTFVMAQFPAGLVIYWTWSNMLTILQQFIMLKYMAGPKKKNVGKGSL